MRLRGTEAGGLRSGEARVGPGKGRAYAQDTPRRFPGVGGECLISEEPARESNQREECEDMLTEARLARVAVDWGPTILGTSPDSGTPALQGLPTLFP